MRAVVLQSPFEILLTDRDALQPRNSDVVVQVESAGVCAGDIAIYRGTNPYASYPCVGGHEIAGVVESCGERVDGISPGERVVVEPFIACGTCYPCRIGKTNCCANLQILGVHRQGGFAEQVVAPATHIHRVPNGLSTFLATFAEPVAIAVHACRRAQLGAERCLILGCGSIGLALVDVAIARGASPIASDVNPTRLEAASRLGAQTLLMDDAFCCRLNELTSGEGAPVVFEATGVPEGAEQAVHSVAAGGRVVILGLMPSESAVSLSGLDLTRKEASILGARASVQCFPEALELLASDRIRYPQVATEFSMWNAEYVFRTLVEQPQGIHKAVLVP